MRRLLLIQGHPDPEPERYGRALARAYRDGAVCAGHDVRGIDVTTLEFPLIRRAVEWRTARPPEPIRAAQAEIAWADRLVLFFPLWMGDMPALLKAFFEQTLRPGYAVDDDPRGGFQKRLRGRSARVVVTMGMPAAVYRWVYRAHSVRSLERNMLGMCGIGPIDDTLIGSVETCGQAARLRWLDRLRELGRGAG